MTNNATKLMLGYNLSRMAGMALQYLYDNQIVSRENFRQALSDFSRKKSVSNSNVDIMIHRLRKNLKPYGIEISVARTVGIFLPKESKDLISDAIYEYDLHYGSHKDAVIGRTIVTNETIRAIDAEQANQ